MTALALASSPGPSSPSGESSAALPFLAVSLQVPQLDPMPPPALRIQIAPICVVDAGDVLFGRDVVQSAGLEMSLLDGVVAHQAQRPIAAQIPRPKTQTYKCEGPAPSISAASAMPARSEAMLMVLATSKITAITPTIQRGNFS
ncbi:hypothetical protein B4Q13_25365, partial [Lacticaseibacillus rhamnosus]